MTRYNKVEKQIEYEKVDIKKIQEKASGLMLYRLDIKKEELEKELEALIHHLPSNCLYFKGKLDKIESKKKISHYLNFKDDLDKMVLIQKALGKAFDQLREIRYHGLGAHMISHAIAFLIHKLIHQLEMETYGHGLLHDKYMGFFNNQITSTCEYLQKMFDPIFQLLTKEHFTKREKQLLFRAFYPEFEKVENHILDFDIKLQYFALYDYCLDRYLELVKKLPDLPKMEYECNICHERLDYEKVETGIS